MMCSLGFLSCLGDVEKRAPPAVGPLAHLRRRSTRPSPVVMADHGSTSDRLPVNITLQRYLQSYKFSSLTRNSFLHRNKLLLLILAFLFSCSHQFYQPQSILPCKTFLFLGCFLRQYLMKSSHIRNFQCHYAVCLVWRLEIRFLFGNGLIEVPKEVNFSYLIN